MALKSTPICNFGEKARPFSLVSTDGDICTLGSTRGKKGLLIMFISNHCPYVKAIREKLVRDALDLVPLGINSVAIMPNDTVAYPEDSLGNMRRIASQYHFPFPYLLDETQEVARAYGAVCTPDFFGYNAELELQYRGRLDAAGSQADAWNEPRELFEAMKQVAETGRGPEHQVPSMGCSIKWKDGG